MAVKRVYGLRVVKLAALVCCACLPAGIEAQSPQTIRYDGGRYDRAGAVAVDEGGEVYIAGSVELGSSSPAFAALKLDRNGVRVWRTNYSGSAGGLLGQGNAIAVDGAGNVYVAGHVSVGFFSTQTDALLIKLDANGVEQWARRTDGPAGGSDSASRLVVDNAGNVYVGGHSSGNGFDWSIQKYLPDGTLAWTRRVSGPGNFDDMLVDMALDAQGNLVVTGTTKNRGDSVTNDISTVKYDPNGTVIWTTVYSATAVSDDLVFDMAVDVSGIYLSGAIAPTADPEGPLHEPLTLRYDAGGTLLRAMQESGAGTGTSVGIDAVGDVYVATGSRLFKYDVALDRIRAVPLAGNLSMPRLAIDTRRNVFVAATLFDPFTIVRDYYTAKIDPDGRMLWTHRFNGTGNREDVVAGAALDPTDALLVTGTSWSNYVASGGTADDVVTLKFAATTSSTPPAAPSSLAAVAISRTQIRLAWSDNAGNENAYSIERCTGAGCSNFAVVGTAAASATSFADNGLARRTAYRYRVRATNGSGSSAYSNIASATTAK